MQNHKTMSLDAFMAIILFGNQTPRVNILEAFLLLPSCKFISEVMVISIKMLEIMLYC